MLQSIFQPFVEKYAVSDLGACLVTPAGVTETFFHRADARNEALANVDPLTIPFPIASLSKSFAAAAILALQEQGALKLSDPVTKFITELDARERWEQTTLYHLLSMSSGLATDNPWADRQLLISDSEFDAILKSPLLFAAPIGEVFHYSNLGYMLLGRIISKASGEHALSYIQRQFLLPLGMNNTDWRGIRSDSAVFGGLTSTLADMVKWIQFFLDCSVENDEPLTTQQPLRNASKRELQRGVHAILPEYFSGEDNRSLYALGLVRYPLQREWAVGHSGGLPGSGCHMRWSLEHQCAVIAWGLSTYCPIWTPAGEILERTVANLPPTYPLPSKLVLNRAEAIRLLIANWDDALAETSFSSNFFQDMPREMAKEQLARVSLRCDGQPEHLTVRGDRGASAFFSHQGTPLLAFSLAPAEGGLIQELRFENLD